MLAQRGPLQAELLKGVLLPPVLASAAPVEGWGPACRCQWSASQQQALFPRGSLQAAPLRGVQLLLPLLVLLLLPLLVLLQRCVRRAALPPPLLRGCGHRRQVQQWKMGRGGEGAGGRSGRGRLVGRAVACAGCAGTGRHCSAGAAARCGIAGA